jgi:hypothetical protein
VTFFLSSHYAQAQNVVAKNNVEQHTKQWLALDKYANQFIQNCQQNKHELLTGAPYASTAIENVKTLQRLVSKGEN